MITEFLQSMRQTCQWNLVVFRPAIANKSSMPVIEVLIDGGKLVERQSLHFLAFIVENLWKLILTELSIRS